MKADSNAANIRQADFLSAFNPQHFHSCDMKKIDRYLTENTSIHKCSLWLIQVILQFCHAPYGYWIIHSMYFFSFYSTLKKWETTCGKIDLKTYPKGHQKYLPIVLSCGYPSKDIMENATNTVMFLMVLDVL